MAKELSKEVDVEVVELVADVTRQMGPEITTNELHLMSKMAKNVGNAKSPLFIKTFRIDR